MPKFCFLVLAAQGMPGRIRPAGPALSLSESLKQTSCDFANISLLEDKSPTLCTPFWRSSPFGNGFCFGIRSLHCSCAHLYCSTPWHTICPCFCSSFYRNALSGGSNVMCDLVSGLLPIVFSQPWVKLDFKNNFIKSAAGPI